MWNLSIVAVWNGERCRKTLIFELPGLSLEKQDEFSSIGDRFETQKIDFSDDYIYSFLYIVTI